MSAPTSPIAPGPLTGGGSPMSYLVTHGARADPATPLMWAMIALSLAVVAIIAVAVLTGVWRRAIRGRGAQANAFPVTRGSSGLALMYVGMPLTLTALAILLVWTLKVMAQVDSPARAPAMTIEITGHEWWWEARYIGPAPGDTFTVANEIHVPVGAPILVKLASADVIHAFWVPGITGKTQTIPGRTNVTWLEASQPGVYRGQCAQFCGWQHAHMALFVVAQSAGEFQSWRRNQLQPASLPTNAPASAGQSIFEQHCGSCHTVAGTNAGGILGPDLTHLMSRGTIAAGTLINNPAALAGWISDPQSSKPGAKMPATLLSGPQLNAVTGYLETLQ